MGFKFGIESCPDEKSDALPKFHTFLLEQGYIEEQYSPLRSVTCVLSSATVRVTSSGFPTQEKAQIFATTVDQMLDSTESINTLKDFAARIGLPNMLGGVIIFIEAHNTTNSYPMPMWGVILLSVLIPVFCCCLVVVGIVLYRKRAGGQKPVAPA